MAKITPDEAAGVLFAYVGSLDPVWAERILVAREENGWTPLQQFGAYISRILDASEHMSGSKHPAFEPGVPQRESEDICSRCGNLYQPRWPGQSYCDECTAAPHPVGEIPERTTPEAEPEPIDAEQAQPTPQREFERGF